MPAEILTFVSRLMETNGYVVRSDGECLVIDPGIGSAEMVAFLRREEARPGRIVLTHGHCDHIAGILELRALVPAVAVWCPAADAEMLTDATKNLSAPFGLPMAVGPASVLFAPGDVLPVGETRWEVLDTSGHTPGGVSLYCRGEAVVFTGDALFADGIGRTDLPGSDPAGLLANIHEHLLSLSPETKVFPGHGPPTTIGDEARRNPFL